MAGALPAIVGERREAMPRHPPPQAVTYVHRPDRSPPRAAHAFLARRLRARIAPTHAAPPAAPFAPVTRLDLYLEPRVVDALLVTPAHAGLVSGRRAVWTDGVHLRARRLLPPGAPPPEDEVVLGRYVSRAGAQAVLSAHERDTQARLLRDPTSVLLLADPAGPLLRAYRAAPGRTVEIPWAGIGEKLTRFHLVRSFCPRCEGTDGRPDAAGILSCARCGVRLALRAGGARGP